MKIKNKHINLLDASKELQEKLFGKELTLEEVDKIMLNTLTKRGLTKENKYKDMKYSNYFIKDFSYNGYEFGYDYEFVIEDEDGIWQEVFYQLSFKSKDEKVTLRGNTNGTYVDKNLMAIITEVLEI